MKQETNDVNWEAIRKESYMLPDGITQQEKVYYERRKPLFNSKEKIDILLRSLGFVAIIWPIWLFYLQEQRELSRQSEIQRQNANSNLVVAIHSLYDRSKSIEEIKDSYERINYDLFPKVRMYASKKVVFKIDTVLSAARVFIRIKEMNVNLDSVINSLKTLFRYGIKNDQLIWDNFVIKDQILKNQNFIQFVASNLDTVSNEGMVEKRVTSEVSRFVIKATYMLSEVSANLQPPGSKTNQGWKTASQIYSELDSTYVSLNDQLRESESVHQKRLRIQLKELDSTNFDN